MVSINNAANSPLPPIGGAPALPTSASLPAVPATPAVATDQLRLTGGQAPADGEQLLQQVRRQLSAGSPVEASLALYQLEPLLNGPCRDEALLMLTAQLDGLRDPILPRVAIEILSRHKETAALPALDRLAQSSSAELRALASQGYAAIAPQAAGPAPAPPSTPVPAIQVVPAAQAPATAPAPATQAPATGAPAAPLPMATGQEAALLERLRGAGTGVAAAVDAAKLPTAQLISIYRQSLADRWVRDEPLHLMTVALAKRIREPGVAEALRELTKRPESGIVDSKMRAVATYALLETGNPAFVPDVLRFVMGRYTGGAGKMMIDRLAQNPAFLQHPATTVALATVVKEGDNPEVMMAASHALGLLRSREARDALANSYMLKSADKQVLMRVMTDLGKHPAPYPPAAIDQLKRHLNNGDPLVVAKAKELLKASGIKV